MSVPDEHGWQPIATAPRDGTPVDLMFPHPRGRTIDCSWDEIFGWHWRKPLWKDGELLPMEEWHTCTYPNMEPTHWRAAPKPPVQP